MENTIGIARHYFEWPSLQSGEASRLVPCLLSHLQELLFLPQVVGASPYHGLCRELLRCCKSLEPTLTELP